MVDQQHAMLLLRRKVKQKSGEGIQVYAERLISLGDDAFRGQPNDIKELQLIGYFIDGLAQYLLKLKIMRDNPRTLQEAIDKARTRFVLLTDIEIQACSCQKARWCTIDTAIFPVALSRLCVINLFIGSQAYHQQYCEAVITIDTKLPMASSLFGNHWAIVTRDNLTFSLVCATGQSTTDVVHVHNPVGVISVPPSCVASNRVMLSSAHNQHQSHVSLTDRDQLRSGRGVGKARE